MLAATINYLACTWWGRILSEHDTEPTEMAGGILKVLLGAQLLLPFDTFGSSTTFRDLQSLPEWLWGVALLSVGVSHLVALARGSAFWRRQFAFIGASVFLGLTGIFLHTSPSSWGAWVFCLAGVWQVWCYVRLRVPAQLESGQPE